MAPFIFWNLAFYTIIRTQLKTVYFTPNKEGKYTVKVTHNNGIGSKIFGIRVRIY